MEKLKCTGTDNKKKIINEYWVNPVAHLLLLNGLKIEGCCGPLRDQYYIFSGKHKITKEEIVITVGTHCAEEFLSLTNKKPLPLSDIFKSVGSSNIRPSNSGRDAGSGNVKMHPINKLLIQAINLLCASWNTPPKLLTLDILSWTYSRQEDPNFNGIKKLNSVIEKDWNKRTLTSIHTFLKENNNLRDIDFTPLHDYIVSTGKESFFK